MPNIQIINPIDYPGWDDLVLSNQDYSFFHSSAWAKVISESYGYNPLYFTIFDKNRLFSLIPVMEIKSILTGRRGISLPFTDYCEPIATEEDHFIDLWNEITQYGKRSRWKYVELRAGKRFFQYASPSYYYYRHTLDLYQCAEKLFSSFRDSTRRNIKKALRAGVKVQKCNSLDSIKEFYKLNCLTRKHHGIPPQPFYFFKNIYDHVISKNHGNVFLASYRNNIIAGAVYFHFGVKAIYKYGASNRNYQNLRANNLVMWEAIKKYTGNNFTNFCLGRTEMEHRGLLQFKEGWNPRKQIINYYKYDLIKDAMVKEKPKCIHFYNSILNKMPTNLLTFLGAILYKHIG